MKKLITRVALGVVALVVLALVVLFFSLNSLMKKGVETVGPSLAKVEVHLGSAIVSPFSGHGRLTKLFVGNPPGFTTPSAIQVGDLKVGVELSSLLSETLVVEEVNIQAPQVTFEGTLGGNNLSKILENIEAASGGDKGAAASSKKEKKFFVKDLVIDGGKINVSFNTPLGGRSATLALPPVHLQNIGSREHGVTTAELSKQIMQPLLSAVTKAVGDWLVDLTKGLQGIDKNAVDRAAKGLKDLLKR